MLRKKVVVLLVALITSCFFVTTCYGDELEPIKVFVNSQEMAFEDPPIVVEGRTTAPLRVIFEELGLEVGWEEETKSITGKTEDTYIVIQIDNKVALVNGKEVLLDVAPFVVSGKSYIPVRFISESIGVLVEWDKATRSVMIEKSKDYIEDVDSDITIKINGETQYLDSPAVVKNGKLHLPSFYVFNILGLNGEWDDSKEFVLGTGVEISLSIMVNSDEVILNGAILKLEKQSKIINDK